jgi:hypothetical protein
MIDMRFVNVRAKLYNCFSSFIRLLKQGDPKKEERHCSVKKGNI